MWSWRQRHAGTVERFPQSLPSAAVGDGQLPTRYRRRVKQLVRVFTRRALRAPPSAQRAAVIERMLRDDAELTPVMPQSSHADRAEAPPAEGWGRSCATLSGGAAASAQLVADWPPPLARAGSPT